MTEAEWLASDEPRMLQDYLESVKGDRLTIVEGVSKRKLQLLACACMRRAWMILPDDRCRDAVVLGERFADGMATMKQRDAAALAARRAREEISRNERMTDERWVLYQLANDSSLAASDYLAALTLPGRTHLPRADGAKTHNDLVRCIFGNPFRPVQVDPTWRIWNYGTLVKLAQSIYEERVFDQMPILADALEDAGCGDVQILTHCRGIGPHARGCFVVDLLLGKK